jgi:hypothetical protein
MKLENEVAQFGPIVSLPAGAQLRTCGEGFNERTLKVGTRALSTSCLYKTWNFTVEPKPERSQVGLGSAATALFAIPSLAFGVDFTRFDGGASGYDS